MSTRIADIQRHHADAARAERLTGGGYAQITPALRLAAGNIVRAKTQEAGTTTDGKLSVKLLDADDNPIGDAFDVWVSLSKSESLDMTTYWPYLVSSSVVGIAQINNEWFLVFPYLISTGKW